MKSFAGFLALVGLAIFLTKGADVKRSCKNSSVAYFVAQQHARQEVAAETGIDIQSLTTPTMQDTSIQHSYLGGCRHFFRAHLEKDDKHFPYEALILGFTEDDGEHQVERFKFLTDIAEESEEESEDSAEDEEDIIQSPASIYQPLPTSQTKDAVKE